MRISNLMALGAGLVLLISATTVRADESRDAPAPAEKKPAANAEAGEAGKSVAKRPRTSRSPHAPTPRAKGKTPEASLSFSNDDLEDMYGPGDAPEPPSTGSQQGAPKASDAKDPLETMAERKSRAEDQQQRVVEARSEVESARQQVARLEKQLLAVKNPFAARPELDEEEKARRSERAEGTAERLARTQKELDEARQRLAEAQRGLSEARASSR